ncbi:MAG: radical SAM superfamily enzyme YgiQ (UPF0313 family)/tetratricopeptide (TPR) repeat protein [Myxococcota bacterium]|jgi:radical SAM superfamily enzyme YgiQ (UPF0313 family)/tetratricopeptide (TPR) repeat protein
MSLPDIADAHRDKAAAAWQRGDVAGAAEHFRHATAAAVSDRARAGDLTQLGTCLLMLGEHDAARSASEQAQALARSASAPDIEAMALAGLGYVERALGRHAASADRFADARDCAGETHDSHLQLLAEIVTALWMTGDLGATRAAAEAWVAALRRADAPGLGDALATLGSVLTMIGRHDDAIATLREATAAGAVTEPSATTIAGHLGLALATIGDNPAAAIELRRAASGYQSLGEPVSAAQMLDRLTWIELTSGKADRALEHHTELMALERGHGFELAALNAAQAAPAYTAPPRPARAMPMRTDGDGPVLIIVPPMSGPDGPLLPRGALHVASFLDAHGVPAVVLPLSDVVDEAPGSPAERLAVRAAVHEAMASLRPRLVGISMTFSHLYPPGQRVAAAVAEAAPGVPVVVGGPHVTWVDRACLDETPAFDIVVRGEGEWTMLDLVRTLDVGGDLAKVQGITWRGADGTAHHNSARPTGALAELPPLRFDLLPETFCRRMQVHGMASRGCRHRCRFCAEHRFWRGSRFFDAAVVADEIRVLREDYDNLTVGIDDSMVNMADDYYFELCTALEAVGPLRDGFALLTRVDTISQVGLRAAERAGVQTLVVGIESISEKVLLAMKKGFTADAVYAGLEQVARSPIDCGAFMLVGHPGDDRVESGKTLAFLGDIIERELVQVTNPAMFVPYPGTPFFHSPERNGVEILTPDFEQWSRNHRPVAHLSNFRASEITLSYLEMVRVAASTLWVQQ